MRGPSSSSEAWEVFARQDPSIPMRHIGRVDAENVDAATVFAYTLYEEWKWTDMFIVPQRSVEQLVRPL